MVGVGIDGKESMLARVSIVNSFCDTVYDTFVAPMQEVVDYRTEFSGVRPQDLVDGKSGFLCVLCCLCIFSKNPILVVYSPLVICTSSEFYNFYQQ